MNGSSAETFPSTLRSLHLFLPALQLRRLGLRHHWASSPSCLLFSRSSLQQIEGGQERKGVVITAPAPLNVTFQVLETAPSSTQSPLLTPLHCTLPCFPCPVYHVNSFFIKLSLNHPSVSSRTPLRPLLPLLCTTQSAHRLILYLKSHNPAKWGSSSLFNTEA